MAEQYFDPEDGGGNVWFELAGDQLLVGIVHFAQWPDSGIEQEAVDKVRGLITPLLDHLGTRLHSIEEDWSYSCHDHLALRIRLVAPLSGQNAEEMIRIGDLILRLCDFLRSATVCRESVADLVRGGYAEILVGQTEGHWLDAKAEEYDLATLRGSISLAQAVARFCNAEDGGLIVIGAKAKKIPGGEVLRQVNGVVPRYPDTLARYQRVLDNHLYPPVAGLRIDLIPAKRDPLSSVLTYRLSPRSSSRF